MFVLFSSEDSITETLYHKRRKSPKADGEYTSGLQKALRTHLDDILDSFSGAVDFPGADVHDHHIHAAAVECRASYLITDDPGFQSIDPDALPYEVHSADSFLMLLAENAGRAVDAVAMRQIEYWSQREGSKRLSEALRDAGCVDFARCVDTHLQRLSEGQSTQGIAREILAQAPIT